MAELKLWLFGTPRIERNGAPITVDTRKAVALLAYLTLEKTPHSRDVLAALLWPEYADGRAALRRTLSALHAALGETYLDADRETIALRQGANVWVDALVFRQNLAATRLHGHPLAEVCARCLPLLAEAAALYRGDFMAGFALRDSAPFDEWQFMEAESLRRDLAGVLERLVRFHEEAGEWEPAIAYARRWVALDPLHEPAHQHLMRLYHNAGQRSAALHQYRECVRVLKHELGVPPLEETTQLYEQIKDQRATPHPIPLRTRRGSKGEVAPAEQRAATDARPALPPLVGRAAEWRALVDAYRQCVAQGRIVVLEGEAGIGKTRLASDFINYVKAAGGTGVQARCYEGEANLAYGPFAALLRKAQARAPADRHAAIGPQHLREAARLVPELADAQARQTRAPLDNPEAQQRFFEGVSQTLLQLCGGHPPGLLFLDDIHWADGATLDLLAYLSRRLHGHALCLLLAWRAEAVPEHHRLRQLLAEAQRAGHATALTLARLDRAEVTQLAQSYALPPELHERLYQETEGQPFFLVEYLTALQQHAVAEGETAWTLPGGVRDLLHSRLRPVSETGWQALTTAAVVGRSFDFEILRAASGRSEEETIEALEELLRLRLIAELRDGNVSTASPTYDFSHEKLRALVYDEISLARRRLLHRRVADALVGRATARRSASPMASLVARHYHAAGANASAAEYFKLAGECARSLYANAEALNHFQMALALNHSDAGALHQAIGDLQTLLGEYDHALASYGQAAALCDPSALPQLERKRSAVYQRRGEWDIAEQHLQAGLAALGAHSKPTERARLYGEWSLVAQQRGQPKQALALGQQALALAQQANDDPALAQVHNILGTIASSHGDTAGAIEHLEASLALAEKLSDPSMRAAALNNLALAHSARGNMARASSLTKRRWRSAQPRATDTARRRCTTTSPICSMLWVNPSRPWST